MLASALSLPLTTTHCTIAQKSAVITCVHSKCVVTSLNKQYEKVHMPNKKIIGKTMVGYAVTMNSRFSSNFSHKQYESHFLQTCYLCTLIGDYDVI